MKSWGRQGQHASSHRQPRSAAVGSRCSVPGCTACCGPRPSWLAEPSASRPATTRRRSRAGGTAVAAPAPRSGSCCWVIPVLPATASTGSRTRPAPSSRAAWPRRPTGGCTCARSRGRRQVQRPAGPDRSGAADRSRPRRHPDRRQRRHPLGDCRRSRSSTWPRPCAGCASAGVAVVVGTCPDLGTDQADRSPAQAGRALLVTPAGGRADDRGGRGGRAHGRAGLDPRAGVRRRPRPAVRAGPVPPLRRRLQAPRRRC